MSYLVMLIMLVFGVLIFRASKGELVIKIIHSYDHPVKTTEEVKPDEQQEVYNPDEIIKAINQAMGVEIIENDFK